MHLSVSQKRIPATVMLLQLKSIQATPNEYKIRAMVGQANQRRSNPNQTEIQENTNKYLSTYRF